MSANTKIEWADHTFNPWIGCTKVSPACDNCYAKAWDDRFAGAAGTSHWGAGVARKRTSAANWQEPLRWNAKAKATGVRQRVFCASLADVFDNEVDPKWRESLLALIAHTPHLDWLLLTKRIGNVAGMLPAHWACCPHPNVWIGATIVNQEEADRDIPKLLAVPAAKRFLSMEPLLGPVDISHWAYDRDAAVDACMNGPAACNEYQARASLDPCIDWVIVGGESGPNARPMHPDWARSLRNQCQAAGVPFLFKQWGEWCPRGPESLGYPSVDGVARIRMTDAGHNGQDLDADGGNDVWMNRAGKKAAGRHLDGREWNEVPA